MKEKKKSKKNDKIMVSKKSIIAIVAIVVLLFVGAIAGIYAYFIDSDSKTNVFTVGNVKIKLTETNFSQSGAVSDVIPGQTINKNPQIQNTGKNSAYVYMEVIVPKESYTHNGTTVTGQ
jgi:flagellar basal body-associated protein FliL